MKKDGNCLFYAIGSMLIPQTDQNTLRSNICSLITLRPNPQISEYFSVKELAEIEAWEQNVPYGMTYGNYTKQNGVYGGESDIIMLSHICDFLYTIYREHPNGKDYEIYARKYKGPNKIDISLLYNGRNHYDLLTPNRHAHRPGQMLEYIQPRPNIQSKNNNMGQLF